jgi:hypothetical protein
LERSKAEVDRYIKTNSIEGGGQFAHISYATVRSVTYMLIEGEEVKNTW